MDKQAGLLGLGIMGTALSANLVKAEFEVVGYDILPQQIELLESNGGRSARSPREVAQGAPILISVLPSPAALDEVVAGKDGLVSSCRRGLIVLECSTFPIEDKERSRDVLAAAGMTMLDCTISGTGSQALVKDITVYGSGDRAAFDACLSVIEGFSRRHYYLGEFGNGSKMKFVANLLVAIHNVAAAEAIVLGRKAGLDPKLVYEVISAGAGSSRMFEVRGGMMASGRYDENITSKLDLWQKDMQVIGGFARKLECPTPLFSLADQFYKAAMSQGWGKLDTGSVCGVLEQMAGLRAAPYTIP